MGREAATPASPTSPLGLQTLSKAFSEQSAHGCSPTSGRRRDQRKYPVHAQSHEKQSTTSLLL